jgi:hypothetical protein
MDTQTRLAREAHAVTIAAAIRIPLRCSLEFANCYFANFGLSACAATMLEIL